MDTEWTGVDIRETSAHARRVLHPGGGCPRVSPMCPRLSVRCPHERRTPTRGRQPAKGQGRPGARGVVRRGLLTNPVSHFCPKPPVTRHPHRRVSPPSMETPIAGPRIVQDASEETGGLPETPEARTPQDRQEPPQRAPGERGRSGRPRDQDRPPEEGEGPLSWGLSVEPQRLPPRADEGFPGAEADEGSRGVSFKNEGSEEVQHGPHGIDQGSKRPSLLPTFA